MSSLRGLYKLMPGVPQGTDPFELLFEVGTVTYSTTDSEAAYRTQLRHIAGGFVNLTGTTSSATDADAMDQIAVPLGAVTSGSITLTRSSKSTSGGVYSVILIGSKYITDGVA